MSLIHSTPDGFRIIGVRVLLINALIWSLIPVIAGGMVFLWPWDRSIASGVGGLTDLDLLAFALMFSPLLTGPFWLALTLATALFTRRGCYGSLVAAICGAVLGGVAAWLTQMPALIFLGAILATLHRFVLALIRPAAF
ncbi:hypothetical protein HOY34_08360 [Xinfangfangia sp. D13-10-4-6]|uniref:hypothetical protein n=1 Tax=Pseudogemmobacter hezensis TaxID=2737662 RepID=UPI0015559973|nr:hypothetical protein [Pseudogemmobacter hezensis]NPD15209.1 hypothetical protein [Pseudogemmobacter hezensis]